MRVLLNSGAYEAKSVIADAQRCINLYPESNPSDASTPMTHYLTPGLTMVANINLLGTPHPWRGLFRASNGKLYGVLGRTAYYIDETYTPMPLGTVFAGDGPVSMQDNGICLVMVNGSTSGYVIDLSDNTLAAISLSNFFGANRVDYVDTYFLFSNINLGVLLGNTNQWYISKSNVTKAMFVAGTAFDPLDVATKNGYPDPIQTLVVMRREIWIIGTLTSEVWYNSGAADFTFQALPGAFIEHGTFAPYSVAAQDLFIYFVSQDKQGQLMVMECSNYQAMRISTFALENEMKDYENIDDAIGWTYQQEGHTFYGLTFPRANVTWYYDIAVKLWHKRAWTDPNGNLNRHRANCCTSAYGKILLGDFENGNLYTFDLKNQTDNGDPITRIRSFPHLLEEDKRIIYNGFTADMQVGTSSSSDLEPVVALRWSDNRGASFGNRLEQSLGKSGQYLTSVQWSRLGMARDRVFELSWSDPTVTALQSAWIDTQSAET